MNEPSRHEHLDVRSTSDGRLERRGHSRYLLSLLITMEGENNFYTGLSQDICESGIFIATHRVLPIGTPVVLSFTLPRSDGPIHVTGTVQWLREPNATADPGNNFGVGDGRSVVKTGMGVRFDDVSRDAFRAIHEFTQRRAPEFFD